MAVSVSVALAAVSFMFARSSWVPYDADNNYYGAATLMHIGVPYDSAVRQSAAFFGHQHPFVLDYGLLTPTLSGLIYPRVVLTIISAPFVSAFGLGGMYVPGILFGIVTVVLVTAFAWRRVGHVGALAVPVLLLGSNAALDFVFGIYTEAPIITLVSAMLWILPLGSPGRRGWPHAVAAAGLVPLMLLSRQVPVLPIALVGGGWLWAWAATRRLRNDWWPFLVTIMATTTAFYMALQLWAPYTPLAFLRATTHSATSLGTLQKLPRLFAIAMRTDIINALHHNPVGCAMTALALVGAMAVWRRALVGVALGALVAGLLTVFLNGNSTYWRYESAAIPAIVVLAAVGVQWLWCRVTGRMYVSRPLGKDVERADPPNPPDGDGSVSPIPSPEVGVAWGSGSRRWIGALVIWSVVAVFLGTVVSLLQPAPIDPARGIPVSSATSKVWPFTVASGRLVCGGTDYEVWFDGDDGQRYALSGTAMSHSFLAPRATSIRVGRANYQWPQAISLLDLGMQLCTPGRHYLKAP